MRRPFLNYLTRPIRNRLFAHSRWSIVTRWWLRRIWPENPNAMPRW